MYEIAIEMEALKDAPVYKNHKRGRNWFARIYRDPASPGGIGRNFADRAHGEFYYMLPSNYLPGTPVEFGADYYSGGGVKHSNRWYGVITERTEEKIVLEECSSAIGAINLGKQIAERKPVDILDITIIPRRNSEHTKET